MRRFLLALLLCAACKHSTSSSSTSHTETSTVTDSTSSESGATTTVTTQTEGPSETTVTTEEFGPPTEASPEPEENGGCGSTAASNRAMGCRDGPLAGHLPPATPTVPRQGPLVKRTVTITERGQETTQTRQEASTQAAGATETKAEGKVDTKAQAQSASAPSAGCIGASWLWGAAILAGVVGVLYFAVKMRKAVP